MEKSYKELRLYTLRGDIRQCLMDGMGKYATAQYLEKRFVHTGSEITEDEFYGILHEEHKRLLDQRTASR